jgi:AcrR family transcriptional regulator
VGRKSGSTNKAHDLRRDELLGALTPAVLSDYGRHRSLRDLAQSIGVDSGILRHYFESRAGLVKAIFERLLPIGQARRHAALAHLEHPPELAFKKLLKEIALAWPILGTMHALGFTEGFAHSDVGLMYIRDIFEPTLDVFEKMLEHYVSRGELRVADSRVAGLALLSPVLLGLFHQHQLQGTLCRPLDVERFIDSHVEHFLLAYNPDQRSLS